MDAVLAGVKIALIIVQLYQSSWVDQVHYQ